jgi:hypothetical protein
MHIQSFTTHMCSAHPGTYKGITTHGQREFTPVGLKLLVSSCWSCIEYVDIRKISVKFAVLRLCEMFTDFDHVCGIGNIWIWFVNQCDPKLIYPAVFTQRAVLYSAYIRFLHIEGMYTNALIYFFTDGDFSFFIYFLVCIYVVQ